MAGFRQSLDSPIGSAQGKRYPAVEVRALQEAQRDRAAVPPPQGLAQNLLPLRETRRPVPRLPQLRPHHRSTAFSVNTRIGGGAESLQRRLSRCREGRNWRVREFHW